jgi:phosphoglycolate phosphatase-like HAD superfamily hydrolase
MDLRGTTCTIDPTVLWRVIDLSVLSVERASGGGARPRPVVVFDLDSTLLDNRPRQAEILRTLGREQHIAALLGARPDHWQGWDLREALERMGLDGEGLDAVYDVAVAYWLEHFFTSRFCVHDEPHRGAVAYVQRILQTGATLAYVTGRPQRMREGTVACFQRVGLPAPGADRHGSVRLLMKPDHDQPDDDWKRQARGELQLLGEVIAAFDNEPAHVNIYHEAFPQAAVVHLATDHSGRSIPLRQGILSVVDFELPPRTGGPSEAP